MTKRLILILSLVLGIGLIASAAYAEVQSIKVSGDIKTLALKRYGFNLTNFAASTSDASGFIAITRVRFDADLTDDVMVTIRLLNERVWGSLDETAASSDIDLDLAYVTLKEFLYSPLTLTVGKQEFRLGSGLIVGDPDTNQYISAGNLSLPQVVGDLSSRKAFDAIIGVLDYAPLTMTLGYIEGNEVTTQAANTTGAGGAAITSSSEDVSAYVVNAAYDFGTMDTIGELYYVFKNAKKGEVNNYGVRVTSNPMENLSVSGEFCYQTSKATANTSLKASDNHAVLLSTNYAMPDMAWMPTVGADFTYLSQDWDVMFEDQTPADIANAILPNTNLQVVGITATAKPMEDVTARLRFANFRLPHDINSLTNAWGTYLMTCDNKSLGNELDLNLSYDYTEDVQLGLDLGYFNAGNAFEHREDATQVIGSMKVTF